MSQIKYIAIHLPQYHPIPENDAWWGKGFTEWTNVAKAKPLFKGHYQPHLPSDLGFYDLRLPEARAAQAEIAKQHGVDGFCYYHYWFHGKRLLERPVDEILASGKPEFPFCLFWANETWEGRWHGVSTDKKTLVKQEYSEQDDLNHIRWLAQAMADSRYIRIEGRPVFLIYRPFDLPDCRKTLDVWRNEALRLGLPNPYFIASDSHADLENPLSLGFDAVLQVLPQLSVLDCFDKMDWRHRLKRFVANLEHGIVSTRLHVYDYESSIRKMLRRNEWPVHRSIIPGWDNSARSGKRGVILTGGTPDKFERLLRELSIQTTQEHPPERQVLFLNAWNEWAEGNHLEPDMQNGRGYLEAVKRVKQGMMLAAATGMAGKDV